VRGSLGSLGSCGVLFLGLALSGCLDAQDADPVLGAAPVDLAAWTQTLAGPGGDAETSLAVSPDGQTVLTCSHGGFTQASPLWVSQDGGESYRRIEVEPNQPFNGDCDVAITEDGAWHIVYDTIVSATFASSDDAGETWWVHPFTAGPVGGVDRPWILAIGNDVVLVWADVMSALPFLSFHTRTSDHGRTWSPPTLMGAFTPTEINCFMAHPIQSPSGVLQVPIVCGDELLGEGPVYLLESRDDGLSWERTPTGARSAGSISASYGGDGGLWLTVSRDSEGGEGYDHGVVHSTDEGRSFGEPLWMDHAVEPGFGWFWVDARPDGSATSVWMDSHEDGTWQASAARVRVAAGQPVLEAVGFIGPVAEEAPLYEFFMVRHDASGQAFVSIPQITGPDCFQPGMLPSQAGSGDVPRNAQCVYVVREPALA
jgi:hypothetical protein